MVDRLVFFFAGFDPKGPSYYHRIHRHAAAQRNQRGDVGLEVGARHRVDRWASAWDTHWRRPDDGVEVVHSRHHFMRWDDIVRSHWQRSPWQLLCDYAGVYGTGLLSGDFARIWRKSRAAWWLAVFPLLIAVLCLGLGGLLGGAVVWRDGRFGVTGAVVGALLTGGMLWRTVVGRVDCEWLLRLYAFTRLQALGRLPHLEARLNAMADHIVETVARRLDEPASPPLREVLLVGYSTGSTVAASVLARALPRLEALLAATRPAAPPALALLTLGHCIPVAADWARAEGVRAELRRLSDCAALTWHDYSAPADWAAFWRSPPWPLPARLRGHQASPRFHAQMTEPAYAALRQDRREMHLQYLRATGVPGDESSYDYLALTSGPGTLAERHAVLQGLSPSSP